MATTRSILRTGVVMTDCIVDEGYTSDKFTLRTPYGSFCLATARQIQDDKARITQLKSGKEMLTIEEAKELNDLKSLWGSDD